MARRWLWKTPLAVVLVSAAIVVAALSSMLYAQASQGEAEPAGIAICHAPAGNPANAHTIVVGEDALAEHEAHGDLEGECVQPKLTGHGRAAVGEGEHPGLGRGAAKPLRGIHARLADDLPQPTGHQQRHAQTHRQQRRLQLLKSRLAIVAAVAQPHDPYAHPQRPQLGLEPAQQINFLGRKGPIQQM